MSTGRSKHHSLGVDELEPLISHDICDRVEEHAARIAQSPTAAECQVIDIAGVSRVECPGETSKTTVERERTLVSDASHELRTPLAVLRTELELIGRERPTGPALQTAISSAIEETDRLSQLADDLLLLARADDHQLTINPSRLAATQLLHQAADRARRQPDAAHKQITVEAPEDAEILADQDRAAQAIDNLLTNALRHANTHVHLSARPNGAFVTLHVIDDGPGFPPDFLPHAWERFARADTARTEDGAGLGLAIVRTIAEAHNGQAHATNAATGGADVWITLPIAPQADQPGQGRRSAGSSVESSRVGTPD